MTKGSASDFVNTIDRRCNGRSVGHINQDLNIAGFSLRNDKGGTMWCAGENIDVGVINNIGVESVDDILGRVGVESHRCTELIRVVHIAIDEKPAKESRRKRWR